MEQKTDKLELIFEQQKALDEFIKKERGLSFPQEVWIQKKAMALIEEVTEVLNEVNYKWWKNPKPTDSAALKEELCDVLHFFVGMCIDAGLDADELYRIYSEKNIENKNRQTGLSAKKGYEVNRK